MPATSFAQDAGSAPVPASIGSTGFTGSTATGPRPAATAAAAEPGLLGTNLGAVTYYDGLVPFANLVDQAGDWVPQRTGGAWGTGDPLLLRADGWPAGLAVDQSASAVIADVRYPAGTYTVRWLGTGSFTVDGVAFGAGTASAGTRQGLVTLDGTSTVVLDISATDPADPVRAIDVRVPGEAPDAVFRTAYTASLAPYRALRFMDWTRTNTAAWETAPERDCAGRTTPQTWSQGTAAGVSVERMVELANLLGADPWFTIPHTATDAWITCVADVVAATLDPALHARWEFGNETWNPTFRAYHDLAADGMAHGLGDGDEYLALQLEHGARHAAAMAVVDAAFAAHGRVAIHVMAGQAANAWVLEQRLSAPGAAFATDELAIAPYLGIPGANPFDPAEASALSALSEAQLFDRLAEAQTAEVEPWIAAHVALADSAGKALVAYEGGQHLAGDPDNAALTERFTSANRSPLMGAAYSTYLARWQELTGNALFMHFTDAGPYTRWGSWGAVEDPSAPAGPKWEALLAYAGSPVADVLAPVAQVPWLSFRAGAAVGTTVPVVVHVAAADPVVGAGGMVAGVGGMVAGAGGGRTSGVAALQVERRVDDGPWGGRVAIGAADPLVTDGSTVTGTVAAAVVPRGSVQFRVRALDTAGNTGAWVEGAPVRARVLGESSSAIGFGGGWSRRTGSGFLGGAAKVTWNRGDWAQVRLRVLAVALVTTRGPGHGALRPTVDGTAQPAIETGAGSRSYRLLVATRAWRSAALHTFRVTALGTPGRPRVDVDAIAVLLGG